MIAREMTAGRPLYSDLWDNKPPLLYVLYAGGQALAGHGAASFYLLGTVAAIAVLLGLAAAAARAGMPAAGLWAAGFWAVLSADLRLQANEPNIELLVNAALCLGVASLVAPGDRRAGTPVLGAGAAFAAATLLKPVIVPVVLALLAAHVLAPPVSTRRRAALQAAAILGMTVAAWAAVAAYFAADGRLDEYWETVFLYNRFYAGDPWVNLREGLRPPRLFSPVLRSTVPLAAAIVAGALVARARPFSRLAVLVASWLAAAPFVVAAPGKFYAHYYQYWVPPLCLGAAWSLQAAGTSLGASAARRLTAVTGAALLAALVALQAPAYAVPADEWSRQKYGDVFLRARDVARQVEEELLPGETFYHWGNEPELYVYTERRPPAGVLWAQHLQYGPLRNGLRARVLDQLALAMPELVVLTREVGDPPGALGRWLGEWYVPHPRRHRREGFWFWVRRGGRLERRLRG